MIASATQFLTDLKALKTALKKEKTKTVNKSSLRKKAEELATTWLSAFSAQLQSTGQIEPETVEKYTKLFR